MAKRPTKAAKKATQAQNAKAIQAKALEKMNAAFDRAKG
jgi:hypothetical protein